MKKFLTFTFLLFSMFTYSQVPTNDEVKQIATGFLNQRHLRQSLKLKSTIKKEFNEIKQVEYENKLLYNVVELEPKGFVIISNDKSIDPILAYSEYSNYEYSQDTTNILFQMLVYDLNNRDDSEGKTNKWDRELINFKSTTDSDFYQWPEEGSTSTGGWIETTWDQHSPYNDMCPLINGDRSPVGCVATALSMIIDYNKSIGGFQLNDEDKYVSNFTGDIYGRPKTRIDDDSTFRDFPSFYKLNQYLDSIDFKYENDGTLNDVELAALNFTSGILVKMNYNETSSGSFTMSVKSALQSLGYSNAEWLRKPGYNNGIDTIYAFDYGNIISNVISGYPTFLGLFGHAVIMDGYNSDGYLHLNFGWGENSSIGNIQDAWYLVDSFPRFKGIAEVIVDIIPDNEKVRFSKKKLAFSDIYNSSKNEVFIYNRMSNNNFTINAPTNFQVSIDSVNYSNQLIDISILDSIKIFIRYNGTSLQTDFLRVIPDDGKNFSLELIGCKDAIIYTDSSISNIINDTLHPYIFLEDLTLNNDDSLRIEAGVNFMFYKDKRFFVNGTLETNGLPNKLVVFTAIDPLTGWGGIQINGYRSKFNYSYISNTRTTKGPFTSEEDRMYGISGSNIEIENCYFINNEVAINCQYNCSVTGSIISNNVIGISSKMATNCNIDFCTITNNLVGYESWVDGTDTVSNSILFNNKQNSYEDFNIFMNCLLEQDPFFVDSLLFKTIEFSSIPDNWNICVNSKAKNSGRIYKELPEYDISGKPRIFGMFADIGAVENQTSARSIAFSQFDLLETKMTKIGSSSIDTLIIYNADNELLSVDSIYFKKNECFSISNFTNNTIEPYDSLIVQIIFSPDSMAILNDDLVILSDALNYPEKNIVVSGIGIPDGTLISGLISGIWEEEFSPYIIIDKAYIEENKMLIVKENVEIFYATPDPINCLGDLIIIGSNNNQVIILSIFENGRGFESSENGTKIYLDHVKASNFERFISASRNEINITNSNFNEIKEAFWLITSSSVLFYGCNFKNCNLGIRYDYNYNFSELDKIQIKKCTFEASNLSLSSSYNDIIISECDFKNGIGNTRQIDVYQNNPLKSIFIDKCKFYNLTSEHVIHGWNNSLVLTNNLFFNNGNPSCHSNCLILHAGIGFKAFNNIFVNNYYPNGIYSSFYQDNEANQDLFYNNIFYNNNSDKIATIISTIDLKYNAFTNFDDEYDSTNIIIDSDFINPTDTVGTLLLIPEFDWHLKNESLCIDKGNPQSYFNDKVSESDSTLAEYPGLLSIRNDIGAYGGNYFYEISDSIFQFVNAGNNDTIHENNAFVTVGTVSSQQSFFWTTSGDGYFNDSTLLNATYTPGLNDIASATVILRLFATSSSPFGGSVSDSMTLFIQSTQQIDLNNGWNIMSFNKIPNNSNMLFILQHLINSNSVIKVINEYGNFVQNIPVLGWMNTIGNMTNTEGYYIKTNINTQLELIGLPIILPYEIPLQTGWNMMGYPLQTEQDALTALQSLINNNTFIKIGNEAGGFIQYIPGLGWINTIGNFEPGEGYYIKVISNDTLVLNETFVKTPPHEDLMQEGHYFKREIAGNPYLPMHIVATFDSNIEVTQGDELGVFVNDVCVGSSTISDPTTPVVAFLTTDDPTTDIIDGGIEGELLEFKLLHHGIEYELQYQNQELIVYNLLETEVLLFTANGLDVLDNEMLGFVVSEVIPNPFSTEARVYITIPERGTLKVSIVDLRGVLVKNLFEGAVKAEKIEVKVDGKGLNPGMYFVRVEYGSDKFSKEILRKVIINRQ